MAEIYPPIALRHMQHLRVRNWASTDAAQPAPVIETDCVHDKHVPLPLAERMPHPCGIPIRRVASAVEKYLTEAGVIFEQDHQQRTSLDELGDEGRRAPRRRRRTRKAVVMRSVFLV